MKIILGPIFDFYVFLKNIACLGCLDGLRILRGHFTENRATGSKFQPSEQRRFWDMNVCSACNTDFSTRVDIALSASEVIR